MGAQFVIDREFGSYYGVCDACGTATEAYDDFQDALDGMKAEGWKITKIGDEWVHYCPTCAPKLSRPTSNEFAGIHPATCTCGCRGGRPVPAAELDETRRKIDRYRMKRYG